MTVDLPQADDAPSNPSGGGRFSDDDRRAMSQANRDFRKVRRAISVARFGGWTTALFAALTLPCALFGIKALFIGVGLAIVAYNEFRGAAGLEKLNQSATTRLGYNQIGFAVIIIVYCVWSAFEAIHSTNDSLASLGGLSSTSGAGANGTVESVTQLVESITIMVYSSVAALSVIFQGGTAWYQFSRKKHLAGYAQRTPEWILQMQHEGIRV